MGWLRRLLGLYQPDVVGESCRDQQAIARRNQRSLKRVRQEVVVLLLFVGPAVKHHLVDLTARGHVDLCARPSRPVRACTR